MDEQELAREAVRQARRDEMYRPPSPDGMACPYCGRNVWDDRWQHGVGTKWGEACINTQADA